MYKGPDIFRIELFSHVFIRLFTIGDHRLRISIIAVSDLCIAGKVIRGKLPAVFAVTYVPAIPFFADGLDSPRPSFRRPAAALFFTSLRPFIM